MESVEKIVLLGCGDVGPIHEPMNAYAEFVAPTLSTGDIRFAQCERTYSTRGHMATHFAGNKHAYDTRLKPSMASVFQDAGFNVISLASNLAMDWGGDTLLDTIALFGDMGIQTIGAGANIHEARKPAILEINGLRVAMLAYCSVVREGYQAGPDSPGVAPLRAHTYYEPQEYQAGTPPRVITIPYEDDLRAFREDIAQAKRDADVVVVSLHWGVHFIPRLIADYQRTIMRIAFDDGADLILGGHAHCPKAIEVYDGRVCFYSLSNFIISTNGGAAKPHHGIKFDPSYPRFPSQPFGIDGKRSMIARAEFTRDAPARVSFLPVQIDMQLRPHVLGASDPGFEESIEFMDWVSEGFTHTFGAQGDEVLIS